MKPEQYKLLARILGYPISVGKKAYDPISEVDAPIISENLSTAAPHTGGFLVLPMRR